MRPDITAATCAGQPAGGIEDRLAAAERELANERAAHLVTANQLIAQQGQGARLLDLLGDSRSLNDRLSCDLDDMRRELADLRRRNADLVCALAERTADDYRIANGQLELTLENVNDVLREAVS